MHKKGFVLMPLLLIIVIGVVIFILIQRLSKNNPQNQSVQNPPSPVSALLNYVPNFDNLTIDDLPNVSSNNTYYTNKYSYKDHQLLLGKGRIIEYDSVNKRILRTSDTSVVPCSAGVIIEDNMYVACNKIQKVGDIITLPYGVLYKIDLLTGNLVKTYFDNPTPLPNPVDPQNFPTLDSEKGRLININVATKDGDLYMGSMDGVIKMDISTEKMESYSNDQIFTNPLCYPGGIFNENNRIIVTATRGLKCWGAISAFNESDKKWEQFLTSTSLGDQNQEEYTREHKLYEQHRFPDFPYFFALSPKKNDMYYILSTDGIYKLNRDQFPQIARKLKIEDMYIPKSVFSQDGKNLLFIGPGQAGGGDSYIEYWVNAYLLNLETLSIQNLSTSVVQHNYTSFSQLEWINSNIEKGNFEEKDGIIYLKDSSSQNVLVSFDLSLKKLTLGKLPVAY